MKQFGLGFVCAYVTVIDWLCVLTGAVLVVSTPSEDPDMKQFCFVCADVTVIDWLIGRRGVGGVHPIRGPRHEAVWF